VTTSWGSSDWWGYAGLDHGDDPVALDDLRSRALAVSESIVS
jgi:hypothetical protein